MRAREAMRFNFWLNMVSLTITVMLEDIIVSTQKNNHLRNQRLRNVGDRLSACVDHLLRVPFILKLLSKRKNP
jgi:hypothetical protein